MHTTNRTRRKIINTYPMIAEKGQPTKADTPIANKDRRCKFK